MSQQDTCSNLSGRDNHSSPLGSNPTPQHSTPRSIILSILIYMCSCASVSSYCPEKLKSLLRARIINTMAQYGGRQDSEYGNQMRRNDEYGSGGVGGGAYGGDQYGTTGGGYNKGDQYGATGGNTGPYGSAGGYNKSGQQEAYGGGGMGLASEEGGRHRRSSSSEGEKDDQESGGRRKKGLMGKIKDMLPGGHKDDSAATTTAEMERRAE